MTGEPLTAERLNTRAVREHLWWRQSTTPATVHAMLGQACDELDALRARLERAERHDAAATADATFYRTRMVDAEARAEQAERERDSYQRLWNRDGARAEAAEATLVQARQALRTLIEYDDAIAEWDAMDSAADMNAKIAAGDRASALILSAIEQARALAAAGEPTAGAEQT